MAGAKKFEGIRRVANRRRLGKECVTRAETS